MVLLTFLYTEVTKMWCYMIKEEFLLFLWVPRSLSAYTLRHTHIQHYMLPVETRSHSPVNLSFKVIFFPKKETTFFSFLREVFTSKFFKWRIIWKLRNDSRITYIVIKMVTKSPLIIHKYMHLYTHIYIYNTILSLLQYKALFNVYSII